MIKSRFFSMLVPPLFGLLAFSSHHEHYRQTEDFLLFAVTGFSSTTGNVTLPVLTQQYKAGKVYISESASSKANSFFKSSTGKKIKPEDFVKISKNQILLLTAEELTSQLRALPVDGIDYFEDPERYPLQQNARRNLFTKVTITGVSALTRSIGILMNERGPEAIIEHLKPHFQKSDYVHISNEVSLLDTCTFSHKGRRFCSKEEHFKALLGLNCNIVELTGNHNKDYGEKTFLKTLEWYKNHNVNTFGGGRNQEEANTPLILKLKDGTTLGFIGFNESCPLNECAKPNVAGANAWNREKAKTVIQKMKSEQKVDVVIASVQFNEWDFYHPQKTQRKIAYDLLDFGADMVFGPHAHQIQQVEFYKKKPIFFGLGNFLFDETQRVGVRQGMFVNVFILNGKMIQTQPVFTFMGDNRVNRIADSVQAAGTKKQVLVDSLLYR